MLELEASVLSKSALKPQLVSHDQAPTLVSTSDITSTNAQQSSLASASAQGCVFFRVFEVADGGPAQAAGLIDGDTVGHFLRLLLLPSFGSPLAILTAAHSGSIRVQYIGAHHASNSFGSASSFSGCRGKRWWMHVLERGQARTFAAFLMVLLLFDFKILRRSSGDLTLEVRPSMWSGRGVLGCRIAAIE